MSVDVSDCDDLLASAWIVVFDDEVDGEVGREPVLIRDGNGLTCTAGRGGDSALLFGSTERGVVDDLFAEVGLLDGCSGAVVSRDRNSRCCGHLSLSYGWGKGGLAGEMGLRLVKDVQSRRGIEDVGGEQPWFALDGGGDELPAFVVDAAHGVASNVIDGCPNLFGAVREFLMRDDLNVRGEGC